MIYRGIFKSIFSSEDAFFNNSDQEFSTLDNMLKFGGSFVKQLSELYRLGDGFNKLKLINAFPEYFTKYRDWK